ncbi:UNVERIFIED_CONTAM: hypothetical protein Sindi_1484900 [Sesamum indicum]
MQDPLPTLEQAFFMIFTVEKQRQVHTEMAVVPQHVAYQFASKDVRKEGAERFQTKRRSYMEKKNLICAHCYKTGHTLDTCFQVHGVPDWYKTLNEKKKKVLGVKSFAAAATNEQHTSAETNHAKQMTDLMVDLIKLMQRSSAASDPITSYSNFACSEDIEFVGNVSTPSGIDLGCWILDTRATNHICTNLHLFHSLAIPSQPKHVHLPDGTYKTAAYVGTVQLGHVPLPIMKCIPFLTSVTVDSIELCENFVRHVTKLSKLEPVFLRAYLKLKLLLI